MRREELIAPLHYNLTSEIEKNVMDPQKIAIQWVSERGNTNEITYVELMKASNRIGNVFLKRGLGKGDSILIVVPRLIMAYQVYIGALKVGLILIPSSEMLKAKDLQYRINHGDVKAVVCYEDFVSEFDSITEVQHLVKMSIGGKKEGWLSLEEEMERESEQLETVQTTRDDIAFLSYTSGTTGNPKAVVHTHGWAHAHLKTTASNWLDIDEQDLVWATAAPGWQKWVWSPFLCVLGTGATGFVYNGKFEPRTYLSLLEKYKINVLCCTPTEYRLMAKVDDLGRFNLEHLQSAVSAGEPLNREVIEAFRNCFQITVRDGYGQTENTLLIGVTKGMEVKLGSMGKPTPGNKVEIINDYGEVCEVGEVGDIAVHISTPALFKEYYKDSERTAMQYRGEYYVTGDRAKKDAEGYFWFEGRGDDIIISSGYTIGPFEVEDALIKHPSVKECAVVASPDEVRGNIVKAFIVLKDGINSQNPELIPTLQEHVKGLTAPYKYPRSIEFINELPKTSSGKIRRIELREKEIEDVTH